jgi:hypothetical protein
MKPFDSTSIDLVFRKPCHKLLERDAGFHPGQGGSQTEVNAVSKCKLPFNRTVGHELIWLIKSAWVAISSPVYEQDDGVFWNLFAVECHWAGCNSPLVVRGRVETKKLFNGFGPKGGVSDQASPLVREGVEHNRAGRNHLGGCFVSGHT